MTLYLQKNTNGTFTVTERNDYKNEIYACDYYALVDGISAHTPIIEIYKMVIEKFGCKKLVLNF